MRRWLISTVLLLMLFAAIISSIRAAGQPSLKDHIEEVAPTVAVFREFQYTHNHWCWRGLCLGETTFVDATVRMRDSTVFSDISKASPEPSLAWLWMNDPYLFTVLSRDPSTDSLASFVFAIQNETFTLIDAILLFGKPQTIEAQVASSDSDLYMTICLAFDVCVTVIQPPGMVSPESIVTGVTFVTKAASQPESAYHLHGMRWHGFADYTPP